MRRLSTIIAILALMLSGFQAYAIKASRNVIEYRQPDGSVIKIQMHGDEFHHWVTDTQGNVLTLDKDQFYRPGPMPMMTEAAKMKRAQAPGRSNAAGAPVDMTHGDHQFLVILVEFADMQFTVDNPKQAFHDLLNQPGYSKNGGTGSAYDYYHENSKEQFNPSFDVYGPYQVSGNYADYGGNDYSGNDKNPDGAFHEACVLADPDIDYSIYDQDGDGYVDNIFFYYAGHNEAEGGGANTIWPHAWAFYYYSGKLDGVRLDSYACTSEYKSSYGKYMCGIGTFCHEFGHVIGLPDFYDTDYESNGYCDPLMNFSLMDSGSYNNDGRTPPYLSAIERNLLGWMDKPQEITVSGNYSLKDITNREAYTTSTENPGEYFLYETRGGKSWDYYIASGMVVYHVDQSATKVHGQTAKQRWDSWNGINCYSDHPCYYIVKAKDSYYSSGSAAVFPGSGNVKTFRGKSWAGEEMDISLNNISYSSSTSTTTFLVSSSVVKILTGTVKDIWGDPVPGAKVSIGKPMQNDFASTVTGNNGTYSIDLSEQEDTDFIVTVSCDGFISQSSAVSVVKNTVVQDFTIYTEWDGASSELTRKYGSGMGGGFGWGKNISIMGSVKYTAEELKEYAGSTIGSISFYLNDSGADAVLVIAEFGNERVMTMNVPEVAYNSWNTVSVSHLGLTIPKDKDVWIGYGVMGPKNGKPLGIDAGPWVEGGGYSARYSTGKAVWQSMKNNGNLLLGVSLSSGVNDVRASGYTYIRETEDGGYIIVPGRGKVVKTVEYANTGDCITANVSYTDGATDVIEMEL